MDIPLSQIKPIYPPKPPNHPIQETIPTQKNIKALNLTPHPEGGYYRETDRNPCRIPNPFASQTRSDTDTETETRSASSAVLYLLTPQQPLGAFHRNQGRTVHVWQGGRGRYVIIHADEVESQSQIQGTGSPEKPKARVETFIVGRDVARGERVQWVVEGGKYKASFLLPDEVGEDSSSSLLISEVGLCVRNVRP